MRIAFILPSIRNCGPVSVVKSLSDELLKDGYTVKVFYFDAITGTNFLCDTERISFFEHRKIVGFDIVHTHTFRPDLFAFLFKNKLNTKIVTTIHSYFKEDLQYERGILYSKFFSFVWNCILIRHDKVIFLSKHMLNSYSNFLFNKKLDYAYNSVSLVKEDEEICNAELTLASKKYIMLGTIAYLIKRKGIEQVIYFLEKNPSYGFLIIGNGPEKDYLENQAKIYNVNERCFFVGFKKNPYQWLKFVKIFVMPSYSEGFPIAVLEAGLCKKAIVCSNLPIYQELFSENEICVFENNNIDALSEAVNKIAANSEIYAERIFNKIGKCYMSIYTKNKCLEIYKQLLN